MCIQLRTPVNSFVKFLYEGKTREKNPLTYKQEQQEFLIDKVEHFG